MADGLVLGVGRGVELVVRAGLVLGQTARVENRRDPRKVVRLEYGPPKSNGK
jgi:hypothetical protein